MFEKKYHMLLSENEKNIYRDALIHARNKLIAEGKYTDFIDDLLIKVLNAKKKRIK